MQPYEKKRKKVENGKGQGGKKENKSPLNELEELQQQQQQQTLFLTSRLPEAGVAALPPRVSTLHLRNPGIFRKLSKASEGSEGPRNTVRKAAAAAPESTTNLSEAPGIQPDYVAADKGVANVLEEEEETPEELEEIQADINELLTSDDESRIVAVLDPSAIYLAGNNASSVASSVATSIASTPSNTPEGIFNRLAHIFSIMPSMPGMPSMPSMPSIPPNYHRLIAIRHYLQRAFGITTGFFSRTAAGAASGSSSVTTAFVTYIQEYYTSTVEPFLKKFGSSLMTLSPRRHMAEWTNALKHIKFGVTALRYISQIGGVVIPIIGSFLRVIFANARVWGVAFCDWMNSQTPAWLVTFFESFGEAMLEITRASIESSVGLARMSDVVPPVIVITTGIVILDVYGGDGGDIIEYIKSFITTNALRIYDFLKRSGEYIAGLGVKAFDLGVRLWHASEYVRQQGANALAIFEAPAYIAFTVTSISVSLMYHGLNAAGRFDTWLQEQGENEAARRAAKQLQALTQGEPVTPETNEGQLNAQTTELVELGQLLIDLNSTGGGGGGGGPPPARMNSGGARKSKKRRGSKKNSKKNKNKQKVHTKRYKRSVNKNKNKKSSKKIRN